MPTQTDITLVPNVTAQDPANITMWRMGTMKDINGNSFSVKFQQGIYSKADLASIREQINAILGS